MNQKETVKLLQNLLFSENKPDELRPVDILLLNYLILRQTEDHFIYDSHLTLAQRFGCDRKTVAESIKRLSNMGWIVTKEPWQWNDKTQRKTRIIGKTAGLSVNLEKLPQPGDRSKHSEPSPGAVTLATQYSAILLNRGVIKRQSKTFDRQQASSAQRLIDYLGEEVRAVLNFALTDVRHQKAAEKSLYEVRTKMRIIKRDFDAAQFAQPVVAA